MHSSRHPTPLDKDNTRKLILKKTSIIITRFKNNDIWIDVIDDGATFGASCMMSVDIGIIKYSSSQTRNTHIKRG